MRAEPFEVKLEGGITLIPADPPYVPLESENHKNNTAVWIFCIAAVYLLDV